MNRFQKAYGKAYITGADLPRGRTTKLIIEAANWQTFPDFTRGKDVVPIYRTKVDVRGEMHEVVRIDDDIESDSDIEQMGSPRPARREHPAENCMPEARTTAAPYKMCRTKPNEKALKKNT